MNIAYQENWETIKQRLQLVWDNEILDRPCVAVTCLKNRDNPPRWVGRPTAEQSPAKKKDFYLNPQFLLERNLDRIDKTYFGGDALPMVFPFWGCGGHVKYLLSQEQFDKHVGYDERTIWIDPIVNEYESFDFSFSKDNPVYQAELQALKYLVQEGKGKFFVAPPDNCGSYDGLAAIRGNNEFITDLIDDPENVKYAGNKVIDALIEAGNEIFDAIRENNDGGSVHGWYHTWSPGKHMQLQCDLSVMISPDMFEEFILEEIIRTTDWLDHSIYHMDGIEQTRFLDILLSVKRLNMIQWVQVAGQPDITHNFHHLKKIQKAGKGIVIQISKNQLDEVLNNTSPYGRIMSVGDAQDQEEADEIVNYVAKHSFRKKFY